jgi:RNA polymerase sigma-70 factor (ECF subfamily)
VLRLPTSRREALSRLADEDLMELLGGGDARALEVILTRHGDAAFSLAYRMCGRRTLAEDIVQETFLSLWRRSGRYEAGRGSVRSWILAAVRHKSIDSFRHEAAMTGRDVSDDNAAAAVAARERTEDEVERREDVRHVRDALLSLPSEQRRVVELAYFGGFTHTEIARMLDLPTGTVKGRARLGLTKMRLALTEGDQAAAGVAP